MHGAGAALRGVAADVGAGQMEVLAQRLHQQCVGRNIERRVFAVDLELHLHGCLLRCGCVAIVEPHSG